MANEDYAIPAAFVFHNGNISTVGKVTYYPIYMLMFIYKEKEQGDMVYRLDLSALK
jgi:hypothetical protein